MNFRIPIYKPFLSGNEKKYVSECLDTSWISSKGVFVNRFEQQFAEYVGSDYAVSVCNGTTALHLALLSLGIQPGDEVIVPTLTYIASVNAITYCGAIPVFVDSKQDSWQIDPEDVLDKISLKTKAILCVHLYGQACEVDKLLEIAKNRNLFLVEDCAEAIGTKIGTRHVGTFGDIATFSFYGNKTITTGEGGMVVCNNSSIYNKLKHYRGQGLADGREYWHDVIGYNYRMTNICAAIGVAQLENIADILKKKRLIAVSYQDALKESNYQFHGEQTGTTHSFWMCSVLVREAKDRDNIRSMLALHGIETRPVFYPIHLMPMYISNALDKYPNAEAIASRGINLPSYPELTKNEVEEIVENLLSYEK